MANLVLWNVPDDVVAALDAQAAALGISRRDLLLRQLVEANVPRGELTPQIDARFRDLVRLLADERAS